MTSVTTTLTQTPSWSRRLRGIASGLGRIIRIMARNRAGFIGSMVFLAMMIVAFIVPYFVPISSGTILGAIYEGPSWAHVLGTDYEGRDIWVQIVHGGQDVILVGFLTAFLTTLIAVSLGSLTAFIGGWFDRLVMMVTDVVLTIPQLPLLAVLAVYISLNNIFLVSLLLALLSWPFLLRSIRAQVLSLKERDYVEAARGLDLGTRHILFSEIMPNMMTYIVINFILAATGAVYAEVGLMYLGLIPLSDTNWGSMINLAWIRGAVFYPPSMLYILAPVLAVSIFQLSLVYMSRSLEDVFNPRLRQGL